MIAYIVKYALTTGPFLANAQFTVKSNGASIWVESTDLVSRNQVNLYHNSKSNIEWFEDKELANTYLKCIVAAHVDKLQSKIEKLKSNDTFN